MVNGSCLLAQGSCLKPRDSSLMENLALDPPGLRPSAKFSLVVAVAAERWEASMVSRQGCTALLASLGGVLEIEGTSS